MDAVWADGPAVRATVAAGATVGSIIPLGRGRTILARCLSSVRLTPEGVNEWIMGHGVAALSTYSEDESDGPHEELAFLQVQGDRSSVKRVALYDGDPELWDLKGVAALLTHVCGWTEPEAVGFALTDWEPAPHIRAETAFQCVFGDKRIVQIRLTIPIWATDQDVMGAWLEMRANGRRYCGGTQYRDVPVMWMNVAWFVYRRIGADGQPISGWRRVWEEWNRHCVDIRKPGWQFEEVHLFRSNFRRLEKTTMGIR